MFYDNDQLNSLICNIYYFYELKLGRIRILRDIDSPEFFAGGIAFFRRREDGISVRVAHRLKDGFEIYILNERGVELKYDLQFISEFVSKAILDYKKRGYSLARNNHIFCL